MIAPALSEVAAAESTKYALASDEAEDVRLNRQHERLKALFGDGLLADGLKLRDGDRILDSGTGTGIWALEAAAHLSSHIEIDGIDITDRLFPSSAPSNLHFSVTNVLGLPESLHSKYALVHQRLLVAAFSSEHWKLCIKNLYSALQPGGCLRLIDFKRYTAPKADKLPFFKSSIQLGRAIEKTNEFDFDIVDNLRDWLLEAGFEDIHVECKHWMHGPGEIGSNLDFSEGEWEVFVRGVDEEVQNNEVYMPIYRFIARKPSTQ